MEVMKGLIYSFLLVGVCIAVPLHAWHFEFSNHTNEELKVMIHLTGDPSPKWYEAIIGPKSSGHIKAMHDFKFGTDVGYKADEAEWWKAGYCLGDVKIQTPLMEQKDVVDNDGNVKVTWVRKFTQPEDPKQKPEPMWNPTRALEVFYIKDEAYDAMITAGGKLADGLTEAAALAASAATGTSIPSLKVSGIISSIGELAAYGQCKDMHFDMVATNDYPKEGANAVFNIIALTKKKG
jgi:hypothetical protein